MTTLWITIMLIGVATCATRVLPLFLTGKNSKSKARPYWLENLGPCLLASMATVVILHSFRTAVGGGTITAEGLGLAAVAFVMTFRRDPGIATLAGMLTYFLAS